MFIIEITVVCTFDAELTFFLVAPSFFNTTIAYRTLHLKDKCYFVPLFLILFLKLFSSNICR